MKKYSLVFICFVINIMLWGQEYVGIINYCRGDLERFYNGITVPVARRLVVYSNSIIDFSPDAEFFDGEIQIITFDNEPEIITDFPIVFKERSILSHDEMDDLLSYIGGNLILSSGYNDPIFEWLIDIKVISVNFANGFKIIISQERSSIETGYIKPLIYRLKPDNEIKSINCFIRKLDEYGAFLTAENVIVEWKQNKNEWSLDFGLLPGDIDQIYSIEADFFLSTGKSCRYHFVYKLISDATIKLIEKETLNILPSDAPRLKKEIEIIRNYEDNDILLQAIERRQKNGLIIKGLLRQLTPD